VDRGRDDLKLAAGRRARNNHRRSLDSRGVSPGTHRCAAPIHSSAARDCWSLPARSFPAPSHCRPRRRRCRTATSPSASIGTPGNGRLIEGVLFPAAGLDHFAWNFRRQRIGGSDRTRWGNCQVVRAVLRGLAAYRRRNPRAPRVAVGDISLLGGVRGGGRRKSHAIQRIPQDARDMHLGTAEPLGDLALDEVLVAAEAYHLARTGVERGQEAVEQ
jgi:hypothetical protein